MNCRGNQYSFVNHHPIDGLGVLGVNLQKSGEFYKLPIPSFHCLTGGGRLGVNNSKLYLWIGLLKLVYSSLIF